MTTGIALVTGAGSGIGRAVTLALAKAGYTTVLAGRRAEAIEAVATEIRASGGNTLPIATDIADAQSVAALFAAIRSEFSRLDVLFNNAGVNPKATPIEDIPLEQWKAAVDINLTGTFLCTQHAVQLMKGQVPQGGRIINNGSLAAHAPRPNTIVYTATKHAITGLTRSTSLDGRNYSIACGQIDIGNAATDMTARLIKGEMQANGTLAGEPRMDLADVASAVVYMAGLPLSANVQFLTVMATAMPFVGRG